MATDKNKNIIWHQGKVSPEQRRAQLKQAGAVVWFTGLSGSGKSTLAHEVESRLIQQGIHAYVLDGDNVRHGLNRDLGFSDADRTENIRRIAEVTRLFFEANIIVLTAFISPFRADRDQARALITPGHFIEAYCEAGVDDCEKRDPKGLYAKARKGEIQDFTGISSPYEAPLNPELRLATASAAVEECAQQVIDSLKARKII